MLERRFGPRRRRPAVVKPRLWTLPVGYYRANCYILSAEGSREALIIDPGDEPERITGVLKEHGLLARLILLTHAHWDHIGAVADVFDYAFAEVSSGRDATEGKKGPSGLGMGAAPAVMLHEADASLLEQWSPRPVTPAGFLDDGDELRVGPLVVKALHTPGHTPGGMCYLAAGMVFTGDTLFAGAVGRTDFPGGSHEQLMKSIREKLLTLPDDTVVYPGHNGPTTIGEERRSNPYIQT